MHPGFESVLVSDWLALCPHAQYLTRVCMRILAGDFQEVALLFLATLLQLQHVNCTITTDLFRSYYLLYIKWCPRSADSPSYQAQKLHILLRCLRVHGTRPMHPWAWQVQPLMAPHWPWESNMSMWLVLMYIWCIVSLEHGLLYYFQEIQCAVIIVRATWRNLHEQRSPHFLNSRDWILYILI